MSAAGFPTGMPRIGTIRTATPRSVFRGGIQGYLSGGKIIDSGARDSGNSGLVSTLRAGLLMGKITSTGKYSAAIMGLTDAAALAGAVAITLTVAAATELLRRVGSTGTFNLVGPPAASGVVAEETVTYSAIDTGTGIVTVTAIGNAYITGSFVMPTDGSQDLSCFIPDGTGVNMLDTDGATAIDQPFPDLPVQGELWTAYIVNYPSDASLKNWLKDQLKNNGGRWTFDDDY